MKTLLQINVVDNSGSTGRIAEQIGKLAIADGWNSYIAFGRGKPQSDSKLIKIGNRWDMIIHAIETRIFDRHGLGSVRATKKLIKTIDMVSPDIIHLHNIHGYYLNYKILFSYLSRKNIPVVWTLHDCWTFTGHCVHYMYINCQRWQTGCYRCPLKKIYPSSIFFDRSRNNFIDKKTSFLSIKDLTLIPVCNWLKQELLKSFFKDTRINMISNGIDINLFSPQNSLNSIRNMCAITEKYIILGVANNWGLKKGLEDFIKLRGIISSEYAIVLIGLDNQNKLPTGIYPIKHTNSIDELCAFYSAANVFVNLTSEDTFPSTNLEALSCGTPVVTYKTGGCAESITPEIGAIIERGDIRKLISTIQSICMKGKNYYYKVCRDTVIKYYDKDDRFKDYIKLYNKLLE